MEYPWSRAFWIMGPIPVLEQRFSTFLMPRPFNTVPHVVVIPNHKIIPKTIRNMYFPMVLGNPCERGVPTH
ncbi:hypothetical protein XENTR_v10010879 [Xenopus tropicalis]|nr:hypothetical protein XENTR_v10010879 [Xenopus tropicalis]